MAIPDLIRDLYLGREVPARGPGRRWVMDMPYHLIAFPGDRLRELIARVS